MRKLISQVSGPRGITKIRKSAGKGGELGDYTGIPLNDAARLRADSWDAALYGLSEWQCRPHASYAMWRSVHPARIWKDVEPITGETIAIHVNFQDLIERVIYMDGRPHPPEDAAHTWAGFSTGTWEGDMLTVTTTHLKEYIIRRDGVPISDESTMIEHWLRHGDYLTIAQIVTDPVYLDRAVHPDDRFRARPAHQGHTSTLRDRGGDGPSGRLGAAPPARDDDGCRGICEETRLPLEAVRGGAETTYPEYRKKLKQASPD